MTGAVPSRSEQELCLQGCAGFTTSPEPDHNVGPHDALYESEERHCKQKQHNPDFAVSPSTHAGKPECLNRPLSSLC